MNRLSTDHEKSVSAMIRSAMVAADIGEDEETVALTEPPKSSEVEIDAVTERVANRRGGAQMRLVQIPPVLLHRGQSSALQAMTRSHAEPATGTGETISKSAAGSLGRSRAAEAAR